MTTNATIRTEQSCHWYSTAGEPCYELPKKNGSGMKSPTLADARKLQLLPSVTTILNVLDKPALNDWRVTQGVLAVLTTPRLPGEADDAFVHRVLQVERVQDQESSTAKDRGTEIHAALEDYFLGKDISDEIRPWIEPAAKEILKQGGELVTAEKILVGDGYAGKTDLITESDKCFTIWDYKTTRSLPPKESWPEHVLQLAAYAAAFGEALEGKGMVPNPHKLIQTANCYISTVNTGQFIIHRNSPYWEHDYIDGFKSALRLWQYLKGYIPEQ